MEALEAPRERAFAERRCGARFTYLSAAQMRERIAAVACFLLDRGLARGERVALISANRLDWIAADLGVLCAGCVSVPLFATMAEDQLAYIFQDCKPRLIFVETPEETARLAPHAPEGTSFVHFDGEGPDSWADLLKRGAALYAARPDRFSRAHEAIDPDALAVLLYTSGTTGEPKGVMLSHDNIATNVVGSWTYQVQRSSLPSDPVALSVLPFAHIMEHMTMFGFISHGFTYHVTVPEQLVADLREVRPHLMTVVPRLLERVLTGIQTKAREAGGVKARLVPWALEVGRSYMAMTLEGGTPTRKERLTYRAAEWLVLRKFRPLLGLDRLLYFVSGSAPLSRDTAYTFAGMGISICEGYGQTETSPVIAVNRLDDNRYGTVGKPISDVEVRIAEDGEILVRGPNVMLGYYHAEQNAEAFTADRWLKTGDIGTLDVEGYLRITGRKGDLFKTSGGKFIAPARLEAAVKRSPYVAQAVIFGAGRPFPIALLALHEELVRRDMGAQTDVPAFMRAEMSARTSDLATYEQIRRVGILPRELTVENGEISPTMKIKRHIVEQRYRELIDAVYAEEL